MKRAKPMKQTKLRVSLQIHLFQTEVPTTTMQQFTMDENGSAQREADSVLAELQQHLSYP
jgi:hypothetical protein